MKFPSRVLLTGGSGTLGQAFMQKAQDEDWDCEITVYSRSWPKQVELKHQFPDVTFVTGDVLSFEHLKSAIAGHDLVIHMAAMKHVVIGEQNAIATIETNVDGSRNVLEACTHLGVDVVGISSDKAVSPANCYGASKMLMERLFQQYALAYEHVNYHLVRYGNVFGSTGSFIHNWLRDMIELGYVRSTDSQMTRFWLTADDALDLIYKSLDEPSGCTLIPRARAAKIGEIEKWLVGEEYEIVYTGQRPGEKTHECLLSKEEGYRAEYVVLGENEYDDKYVRLHPAIVRNKVPLPPRYSNASHIQMKKEEFLEISGTNKLLEELEKDADDNS